MNSSNKQDEGDKVKPTKKATTTKNGKVTEWKSIVKTSRQATTAECVCSICMEIVVDATIVNPCGHVFCASCILCQKLHKKECANCRARMESTTRCKAMDNIIRAMVMRGDFQCDDFFQYWKRSKIVIKLRKV